MTRKQLRSLQAGSLSKTPDAIASRPKPTSGRAFLTNDEESHFFNPTRRTDWTK